MEIKAYMSKTAKLVIVYCVLCTVLFIAVFTLFSYTGKLPQTWVAAVFTTLYCIATAVGVFMIIKFSGASAPSDAPPKSARAGTHLFRMMKTPVAVTDADGRIIWYNDAFSGICVDGLHKDTDTNALCGLTVNDILEENKDKGAAAKIGDRTFRVFGYPQANNNGRQITTMWFDVSDEEAYKTQIENERLIIAYIIIDMADNILSGMQEQYSEAVSSVSKLLNGWADSCDGHLLEYSAGKYIMMFYAEQLPAMRRASFPILSDVKKITFGGGTVPMTLSIGIADMEGTVSDKCALASSAMSFALQRGGDQVVIKNDRGTKDEFYGGLSKHDPQLTGLNARRLILQAKPIIKEAGSVYIMGHNKADFDCLASCMGIAKICLSLGKKTTIVVKNNENITRPYAMLKEMPDYKDLFFDFERDTYDNVESNTLLFIMDVNNPEIFEDKKITNQVSSIIIIDHHRRVSSEFPFEEKIRQQYIEPSASSASEIVAQMLEQFFPSGVLTADEANLLLAGIQLDTNSFTRDCGAGTYAAAQYLRREGADAAEASSFFSLNKKAFMFELRLQSSMKLYKNEYAICVGDDAFAATDSASCARVAETVLKLEGVSASFAACRGNDDSNGDPTYSISARSDGSINVQVILERLGGGGHHSNAGTQLFTGKMVQAFEGPLPKLDSALVTKLLLKAIDMTPKV